MQGNGYTNKNSGDLHLIEALFQYASLGIVITDRHGEILCVNNFAGKQFGYTPAELLHRKIDILIPQRFHESHARYMKAYSQSPVGRPMGKGMELHAVKKDGTEFPVEISLGYYQHNSHLHVIAFINDISERLQNEKMILKLHEELEAKVEHRTQQLQETMQQLEHSKEELARALEKEKELNELKSRFVSMASHEFRTPLSTVLSSTYLLEKYTTTEEQPKRQKHIERIKSSVHLLTETLNDFLSVGRIEEGKIVTRPVMFNLEELVTGIVNEMKSIQKEGQQIHYYHAGESLLKLDPSLLKHIVMNLLGNAIKFSPPNSRIEVGSNCTNGEMILSVKDQGIGIPRKEQEHLFERFFRATNTVNIQGTGLGLHIVAKYAALMNGKVACKSEINEGTEMMVTFTID